LRHQLPFQRKRRRLVLFAAAIASPVALAPNAASAEGLFDFLFGGSEKPQARQASPQASFFADPFGTSPQPAAPPRKQPMLSTELPIAALTYMPASSNLYSLLEMMQADMEKWSALEGSPEDVEAIMATDIAQRCDGLEDDDTLDPIWDFREVYTRFKAAAVQSLHDRSAHWLQSVVSGKEVIGSWSIARCDNQLNVVSHPPAFLSAGDKGQLEAVQRMIEEQRVSLVEEVRRDKAYAWLHAMEAELTAQSPLARDACEQCLYTLRHPPAFIQAAEIASVKILEEQLTRRIDTLDVSALLERIHQLQPSLRRELLQDLQQAFPEDFAHP